VGIQVLAFFAAQKMLPPAGSEDISQFIFLAIALMAGMTVSGTIAVGVERVAYRPLRNAPRLVLLISAIGVSFVLADVVRFILSASIAEFDVVVPSFGILDRQVILIPAGEGGIALQLQIKSIFVIIITLAMLLTLNYFVGATKSGTGIRAVAQNRPAASLMGINVNSIIALTFLIGGALGGAAGLLFALEATRINAFSGFLPGLRAFTAAVLGGIGNLTGALLGGLILGMLESFAGTYLTMFTNGAFGAEYKDIATFAILIIVLIFRPSGLLGQTMGQKA